MFLAKQHQLEEKLQQWQEIAGTKMQVEYKLSYSGHKVYAITLSDFSVPRENKTALYVAQPHAHEPATTAGIIDVIEQLLTGKDLAGNATRLDVDRIMARTLVTFNPIGNPYGRENAPYLFWDGTKVSNQRFSCLICGEDPEAPGQMWNRLDQFDIRQGKIPNPIGIIYEPIDAYHYVEPNRSQLSTYFQLFHHMDAQYHYQYWLDLHQMEFENSPAQCVNFLPLEESPAEELKPENLAWAQDITASWQAAGYVAEAPIPLPYGGIQAEYFIRNWKEIDQRMHRINVEVKNNAIDFPPQQQMAAIALAIETTLDRLVSRGTPRACPDA
jgi:hypothetical protein